MVRLKYQNVGPSQEMVSGNDQEKHPITAAAKRVPWSDFNVR